MPAYPPRGNKNLARLLAIIEDVDARVILSTSSRVEGMAAHLPFGIDRLSTDMMDTDIASDWGRYQPSVDDVAFLQYTSGSTGNPKGVIVSHGNLMHNQLAISRTFQIPAQSVIVSWLPCYGMAETTLVVSGGKNAPAPSILTGDGTALEQGNIVMAGSSDKGTRRLVGSGRVCSDMNVVIVDPASGISCPPGKVGEIWVSGPSVVRGYWNHPESTEQTFQAYLADTGEGPFLRTGDLGFLQDEEFYVTGRHKDLIIIRGRNYFPSS